MDEFGFDTSNIADVEAVMRSSPEPQEALSTTYYHEEADYMGEPPFSFFGPWYLWPRTSGPPASFQGFVRPLRFSQEQ